MSIGVPTANPRLAQTADWARSWLFESAAPLWAGRGREPVGLFAERMTLAGEPDATYFRTFVQARHVFSFVSIGQMGWNGPWRELVTETTEMLIQRVKRVDGFYVHSIDAQARHLDSRADLYDQAFVLLALGSAGGALNRPDWFDEADALLSRLEAEWEHPAGGFMEGEIADRRLRRQNPHMHLLEAFLALHEASGHERFKAAAHSIAALAEAKFIDHPSGALLEYFSDDLRPAPGEDGRILEPGHCFEWAWLFERLAADDWPDGARLSDGLTAFAREHGIDARRGVAVNELLTDGTVRDATARLWPQTERLKAAVARYRRLSSVLESEQAIDAAVGLQQYLNVPLSGLWRDKLRPDSAFAEELAPGSSLYHISCAFSELVGLTCGRDISRSSDLIGPTQP